MEGVTPQIKERLIKAQVSERNVLLATVKSKTQLEINLQNGFYYMPVSAFDITKYDLEYIAIYQSVTNFQNMAGIHYYGKIQSINIVRRCDIEEIPKDSNELYYYFRVKWNELSRRIKPQGNVKTFYVTSFKLMCESENVAELFIRFYDEYKIINAFKKFFKNIFVLSTDEGICEVSAKQFKLELYSYRAILYKGDNEIFNMDRIFFRNHIDAIIKKLSQEIFP